MTNWGCLITNLWRLASPEILCQGPQVHSSPLMTILSTTMIVMNKFELIGKPSKCLKNKHEHKITKYMLQKSKAKDAPKMGSGPYGTVVNNP